jgi:hypothetical protein
MQVLPKNPPRQSCGLKPGTRVRVTKPFASLGHSFAVGEELIYVREMFDIDMGCDLWMFATEESRRIEESLPEGGIVNGRYLWHELVRHNHVYGMDGLDSPSSWLPSFEIIRPYT